MGCDRWATLKVFEFGFAVACLICKTVSDDEAQRLFLYLQKISREWSLLNQVTWDKYGSSAADATYGGYVIITFALMIGKLTSELPTTKRVSEYILLVIGIILYAVLGSLSFASIEHIPHYLIDNASVLGALSIITALLFLVDLGAPRAKKTRTQTPARLSKGTQIQTLPQYTQEMERPAVKGEKVALEAAGKQQEQKKVRVVNGVKNGAAGNGYKKMKETQAKRFDIYGKDAEDFETESEVSVEKHSPVWGSVRKGQYSRQEITVPSYMYPRPQQIEEIERPPSGPGDPGYVQYTAQRWGQPPQKTPRHSPTTV